MGKGKATTKGNPKLHTKAPPKKAPKPPAPKKVTTQSNKNKGTGQKRVANDQSSESSDEENPRPCKKCAKPLAPTSNEEDGNKPEDDEPEVILVGGEERGEHCKMNVRYGIPNWTSIQKVNNTLGRWAP